MRCPSGPCVSNLTACTATCERGQIQCWDRSCASALAQCPCPSGTSRCPTAESSTSSLGGLCVASLDRCNAACPAATPAKCWNGICVQKLELCPCNATAPFRCPVDNRCYASAVLCPCPADAPAGSVRCATNSRICAASASACEALPKCMTSQVLCGNGVCANSTIQCMCQNTSVMPQVNIMAASDGTFDVTRFLRLSASLSYTVCGVDRSALVRLNWSIAVGTSASAFVGNTKGSFAVLTGAGLALPPNYFPASATSYLFTVVAWVEGRSSTASVTLQSTVPLPKLSFVGGANRTVSASGSVRLYVVAEGLAPNASAPIWTCCSGSGCASECDAAVVAALSAATGPLAVIPASALLPGSFTVTYFLAGASASQTVMIVTAAVPIVQILTRSNQLIGTPIELYAVINSTQPVNVSWTVNGNAVLPVNVTARGCSLRIAPLALAAGSMSTVTARAVSAAGTGSASFVVSPVSLPTIGCTVATNDATTTTVTSLSTSIRISVTTAGGLATATSAFRFGYVDPRTRARISAGTFQSLASFDMVAPLVGGNATDVSVMFFAALRYNNVVDAAWAMCELTVAKPQLNSTELRDTQTKLLDEASANSDASEVVRTAATLASVEDTNATSRNATRMRILWTMQNVLKKEQETMSSELRQAAVSNIASITANRTLERGPEQDSAIDVLRTVLGKSNQSRATDSDTQFNAQRDGPMMLDVLSRMNLTRNVTEVAEKLAAQFASSIQTFGENRVMSAANLTIVAQVRSAQDVAGRHMTTNRTAIALPSRFAVFDNATEDSVVAISATEYAENPLGTAGVPQNRKVVSSVVDFTLVQDGVVANITNLVVPIQINITVDISSAKLGNVTCMYFNTVVGSWDSTGVRAVAWDPATRVVTCNSTHLSTFALADEQQAPPPPSTAATPTTAVPSAADTATPAQPATDAPSAAATAAPATTIVTATPGQASTSSPSTAAQTAATAAPGQPATNAPPTAAQTTAAPGATLVPGQTAAPAGTTRTPGQTSTPGATLAPGQTAAPGGPLTAPPATSSKLSTGAVVGIIVGVLVVFGAVGAAVWCKLSKQQKGPGLSTTSKEEMIPRLEPPVREYDDNEL